MSGAGWHLVTVMLPWSLVTVAVVGLDHVAAGDGALARGRHGHVVHDGHLHVEAVAESLWPSCTTLTGTLALPSLEPDMT